MNLAKHDPIGIPERLLYDPGHPPGRLLPMDRKQHRSIRITLPLDFQQGGRLDVYEGAGCTALV